MVVDLHTDHPERFAPGNTFTLEHAGVSRPVQVTAAREHQGRMLVSFAGIGDRTAAEQLRGGMLFVAAEAAAPAESGRYYPHDLEGAAVVDAEGETLGTLVDVMENPANDLWVVRTPDGKDVLVPAVRAIVVSVEPAAHRIVLRPPPGLFE